MGVKLTSLILDFLRLKDTPATYAGSAGKYVKVNAGETALEFGTPAAAAHAANHVTGGGDTIADAIAAGNSGLLSGADKTKLDGIEALADVTDAINIASSIVGVADKAIPVDADSLGLIDSAAANALKELTWANVKATLKTYLDTLYSTLSHASRHVTGGGDTIADAIAAGNSGLMSGADKTKLDGIEALAEVNNISDINATDLTDSGDSTLHYHATDRALANATGQLVETKGGTNQITYAQGDLLYASAIDTLSKLVKGTALQVLTMNAGATAPGWAAAAGGAVIAAIWLPAEAAYLPVTNPAALVETAGATVYAGWSYLAFDDTTSEHAVWRVPVPDYNGGNIVVTAFSKPATTPAGAVTLQYDILTIGLANSEAFDAAVTVDTTVNISHSLNTTELNTDICVTSATIDPANVSADDLLVIELARDVATDTLVGDGQLIGILLEYTKT